MAKKYYVLKPFTYAGKPYVRGDEFDAEGLGMHSSKIEIRVKAHLLVEESRLTPSEKAKLLRDRATIKTVTTTTKQTEKPAEKTTEPVSEPQVSNEPVVEEPTLFSTNVGGGKGKNKNRNN